MFIRLGRRCFKHILDLLRVPHAERIRKIESNASKISAYRWVRYVKTFNQLALASQEHFLNRLMTNHELNR